MSNGDKILSENYLQHADHFTRVLHERDSFRREKNQENKIDNIEVSTVEIQATTEDLSDSNLVKNTKNEDEIEKTS